MIANDLVSEAADYSEFMQNVIRQEPDFITGNLLAFAAAYLEIVSFKLNLITGCEL
jgi:hypothetical protein